MKVIIAGGRENTDWTDVFVAWLEATKQGIIMTELVCGMAPGVDETGYYFAKMMRIPIAEMPADWDRSGRAAGPLRNKAMAQVAEALIAVWDGRSPGTKNMIEEMQALGKPVFVRRYDA